MKAEIIEGQDYNYHACTAASPLLVLTPDYIRIYFTDVLLL